MGRRFLQRSPPLVNAALTLHRYLETAPCAQGASSTRSSATGIQFRIQSDLHLETTPPFVAGRSLQRLRWALHNAQTPGAATSLVQNRRAGFRYNPEG